MSKLKILNLYAGIGGNRKLWGDDHDITAVEINPKIAECYKKLFPNDTVIVGDAHEYLRKHFREYDFIWASPPCPTHSALRLTFESNGWDSVYPDMTLYQEIILLKHFYQGSWVIENVKPYYKPLIEPSFALNRHYFWSNKFIMAVQFEHNFTEVRDKPKKMAELYGIDINILKDFSSYDKRKILRNCVKPEIGKYIFEQIMKG